MKYIVCCTLNDKSINELRYFENKNSENVKITRTISDFQIPIMTFNSEYYSKLKPSIIKKIQKIESFRINISKIKTENNKVLQLLIEAKGFLSTIERLFEQELLDNNFTNYEKLKKNDLFNLNFIYLNKNSYDINSISYPNFVKVSCVTISKHNYKRNTLIDSFYLKNI